MAYGAEAPTLRFRIVSSVRVHTEWLGHTCFRECLSHMEWIPSFVYGVEAPLLRFWKFRETDVEAPPLRFWKFRETDMQLGIQLQASNLLYESQAPILRFSFEAACLVHSQVIKKARRRLA